MTTTLEDEFAGARRLMPVGGSEIESASTPWHDDVTAPSQPGKVLARVPAGTAADVGVAVHAARHAQREWAAAHFTMRQQALLALVSDIQAESERLAVAYLPRLVHELDLTPAHALAAVLETTANAMK